MQFIINKYMKFEDSRFALFSEPNAYVQKFDKKEDTGVKKIVFQEPYETLPNFYINNNFTKHDCECVKNKENKSDKHDCNCNHNQKHNQNNNCYSNSDKHTKDFSFDLKNLLPIISLFNKGGTDLSSVVGLLNNEGGKNNNPMNLISSLMQNKDMMSGILNIFKGGVINLFNKNKPAKKELKTTDFEIKNYTRVD